MIRNKWTVRILPENKVVRAAQEENLSDILRDAGVPLSNYCQKRGLCGKCFVEVLEGDLPPFDAREKRPVMDESSP